MIRWKILGYSFRKNQRDKLKVLCYIDADSFDAAIEKARNIYGRLQVVGAQPL